MTAALASRPTNDDSALLAALPFVARRARRCFCCQPAFQRDEYVADSVTAAFLIYRGLQSRGRTDVTHSKGFAFNACRAVGNGKPMGLGSAPSDVLDPVVRRRGRVRVESLNVPACDGWMDMAVEDKKFGPAEAAAFRIDFKAWRKMLNKRDRRIMDLLAAGERGMDVAARFGVSAGRISQLRRHWAGSWRVFQGQSTPRATTA